MAAASSVVNSNLHANRDANVVSNTYNYGPQLSMGPDPISILRERVAFGALDDSAERVDPPKCHPETRTAVINLIDQWAKDRSDTAQPVFWLTGAAGAGKSAIAQTMVEKWKKEGIVVLSFFFWRTSSERNQKTKLVPTLSYQLSKHYSAANAVIKEAVSSGDVFKKRLEAQFEELILRPLANFPTGQCPVLIVIDGVDECCVDLPRTKDFSGQDFKSQQREILDAIALTSQQVQSPRFLVVSRPEQVMRTSFAKAPLQEITRQLSLNEAPDRDEDIQLYLVCGFDEIRRNYPSLPSVWPGDDRLSELVRRSSGQFIYASTVVRYIIHRPKYPEKSLQDVLGLSAKPEVTDRHPLADLDELYALILKSVSTESLGIVRLILGILCYLTRDKFGSRYSELHGESDAAKSPYVLEELLFLSHGELLAHLTDLHSILHIPPAQKPRDTIRIVHATLSEYLQDESRSKDLHISRAGFLPNFLLLLLRHLDKPKQEAGSAIAKLSFEEVGMDYYFSHCFANQFREDAAYSREAKNALWDLLKDEIGSYTSLNMYAKFNSEFGIDIHNCPSCGHVHYISLNFKRFMLDYLLGSNISAFEHSIWRRLWNGRRLKRAKKVLERRKETLINEYERASFRMPISDRRKPAESPSRLRG